MDRRPGGREEEGASERLREKKKQRREGEDGGGGRDITPTEVITSSRLRSGVELREGWTCGYLAGPLYPPPGGRRTDRRFPPARPRWQSLTGAGRVRVQAQHQAQPTGPLPQVLPSPPYPRSRGYLHTSCLLGHLICNNKSAVTASSPPSTPVCTETSPNFNGRSPTQPPRVVI